MTASAVLLGDIGATNARFALLTDGLLGPVKWIAVARYPQFADAIEDLGTQPGRAKTPFVKRDASCTETGGRDLSVVQAKVVVVAWKA